MNKKIFKSEKLMKVEFYMEGKVCCLYISHEGSSGCRYQVKTLNDISKAIKDYVEYYLPDYDED